MNIANCLAIDIGGTNTKLAIVSSDGKLLFDKSISTQDYPLFTDFAKVLETEFKQAISDRKIVGIGIGCPNYNNDTKTIENAPNLPWGAVKIDKILQELSSVPVSVEKDAPLAALGEYVFGQKKLIQNLAIITIGTGVGSGFIVNGTLHQTPHGFGSEAGHLIVGNNKRQCGCGGFDHLESYASVTALRAAASLKYGKKTTFTELKDLYLNRDPIAIDIISEAANFMAIGITQVVNIVGSKKVVLAGGGISLGEVFLGEVQANYKKLCFKTHFDVEIEYSALPINHGALLGAAALVFNRT